MYLGYYETRRTLKNQLTFPSKFKEITGTKLLITTWFENSLLVLPQDAYEAVLANILGERSSLLPEVRDLERFFFQNAVEIELDMKSRFILPAHLKDFAKIGKEAVFVGVKERIELWDAEIYRNYGKIREVQIRETAINHYNRIFNQKEK